MPNKIIAHFTGPEHIGKTSIEVAFAKFLESHGVTVTLPPDPQRDAKMDMSIEELMAKVRERGPVVLVMETQTAPVRA